MKTTKHRLILPMQAKGNVGKSIETAARACWLLAQPTGRPMAGI
jgi:hypothetical protein